MKRKRLIIIPKDICIVMGISERQARRIYHAIKDAYGKQPHHHLTFNEFAQYINIPVHEVRETLGLSKG